MEYVQKRLAADVLLLSSSSLLSLEINRRLLNTVSLCWESTTSWGYHCSDLDRWSDCIGPFNSDVKSCRLFLCFPQLSSLDSDSWPDLCPQTWGCFQLLLFEKHLAYKGSPHIPWVPRLQGEVSSLSTYALEMSLCQPVIKKKGILMMFLYILPNNCSRSLKYANIPLSLGHISFVWWTGRRVSPAGPQFPRRQWAEVVFYLWSFTFGSVLFCLCAGKRSKISY